MRESSSRLPSWYDRSRSHSNSSNLGALGGMTETRTISIVDDELTLEPDITEDRKADTAIALDTTEALTVLGGRGIVQVRAWNGAGVVADGEAEVGKCSVAWEDVATFALAVG